MKKGLVSIISAVAGASIGAAAVGASIGTTKEKEVGKQTERANKNASVIDVLARWISLMQDGKSLIPFFEKYHYNTVAIYGMHYVGERLHRELTEAGIEVKYAIDQRRNASQVDVLMKKLEDSLEEVDAVIVTPVFYFDSIEEQLMGVLDCPIISFEDILDEMEELDVEE